MRGWGDKNPGNRRVLKAAGAGALTLSLALAPGPSIALAAETAAGTVVAPAITSDSTASHRDVGSFWPGYRGGSGGVVRGLPTPTQGARAVWARQRKSKAMYVNASDAIIVNDASGGPRVFDAASDELYQRELATGEPVATIMLAGSIDSTSRLTYADGLILVPLSEGRLQAVSAETLQTLWVSDALPAMDGSEQQSLSTPTILDGSVYLETVAPAGMGTVGGYLVRISLSDGSIVWSHENDSAGYYWTNAASFAGGLLTVDDAGEVCLYDAATGAQLAAPLNLGHASRANIVVSEDGGRAYIVTTDGVLHEVAVATGVGGARTLMETRSLRFGSYSTCTPTLCDGKIYVGGSSRASLRRGALCEIDESSFTLLHEALVPASAGGTPVAGDVKSAPLVSVTAGGTYVYVTCNSEPGGVYVWHEGDPALVTLFVPAEASQRDYCFSSITCDEEGGLIYFNDSGTLFRLKAAAGQKQSGTSEAGGASGGTGAGNGSHAGAPASGSSAAAAAQGQPGTGSVSGSPNVGNASGSAASDVPGQVAAEDGTVPAADADADSGDDASNEDDSSDAAAPDVPTWPIIGIVAGLAVLAWLAWRAFRGHKKEREQA